MPRRYSPESETDMAFRLMLHKFLKSCHDLLERTHRSVVGEASRVNRVVKEAITQLWKDGDHKLRGVISSQEIGNPRWRRESLADAGVFGSELSAKQRLFDYFAEERRFLAVLKFLASVFGSLSKAFPVLSAVKEFIDAVLCARDWLPDDPEIIGLGELS